MHPSHVYTGEFAWQMCINPHYTLDLSSWKTKWEDRSRVEAICKLTLPGMSVCVRNNLPNLRLQRLTNANMSLCVCVCLSVCLWLCLTSNTFVKWSLSGREFHHRKSVSPSQFSPWCFSFPWGCLPALWNGTIEKIPKRRGWQMVHLHQWMCELVYAWRDTCVHSSWTVHMCNATSKQRLRVMNVKGVSSPLPTWHTCPASNAARS